MSLKKQAFLNVLWSYTQQIGNQLISFVVSLILTRLLMPAEFGLIGMITVFMGVGGVLINGGLTSSLIRSKETTHEDYNTVFLFNFVAALFVYCILYTCAPFIATFYKQPILTPILRVQGITFIIGAFSSVQGTILVKEMKFKLQFLIGLPSIILSNAMGIFLAFKGYGVWSIIWSNIFGGVIGTIILWLISSWKPKIEFNRVIFQKHFHFGYKMALSGILDVIFTNIYQIMIGRLYVASLVGFYTRANTLMMLPVSNISNALNSVVFPLFSSFQDDVEKLKSGYKQIMQLVLFLVTPTIVLMAILGKPLIIFLFTEKWLPVVPIFQIIAVTGILYPIHSYNLLILQVRGRSDLFLKLEIVKKVMLVVILILSLYFGFYGLLWGQLFFSILALFINTHFAGSILNYPMWQQLKDIFPSFLYALIMAICVYYIMKLLENCSSFFILSIAGSVGLITYISAAFISNDINLKNLKSLLLKK